MFKSPVGTLGEWIPDLRKIGVLDRRLILSRKRTRNLFDLTNIWKNNMMLNMEQHLHDDVIPDVPDTPSEHSETDSVRQAAFDDLFDPWPTDQVEEILPRSPSYYEGFRRSPSPDRNIWLFAP